MTLFEKAIFQAIKAHNSNEERHDDYLAQFNRGIKFLSMAPATGSRKPYGDTKHYVYPHSKENDWTSVEVKDVFMRLEVKCKFSPTDKYEPSIVLYEVLVISSGEIVVYFDGTEYPPRATA